MNKTFALLVRALRTDARDVKSHMFRGGLAGLIVMILYFGHGLQQQTTAPGMQLFKWMIIVNWVFVTLAGVTVFAVSISEETEHESLGLLRMANIGPLSLLLGKWLPRMLMAFALISVQFPFTWLTATLGGVSWEQIRASYLLLLAHLVLVGNVGLLASVLRPTSMQACSLAVMIILIARILPFLILAILQLGALKGWWAQSVVQWYGAEVAYPINSCTASGRLFGEILSTSFRGAAWTNQVASNLLLGGGLFCVSWVIFDRVTMQHLSGGPPKRSFVSRIMQRTRRSSSSVWDWALAWKDFHQVAGGMKSIVIKVTLYLAVFFIAIYVSRLSGSDFRESLHMGSLTLMMLIFWVFFPLELCLTGGKLFRPELQNQTWSTLLTLPKSLGEVVYSKLGGAALGLLPSLVFLLLSVIPNLDDLARGISRDSELLLGLAYYVSAVILAAHLATYFTVLFNWAIPLIAVVSGVGVTFIGNILLWVVFAMMQLSVSGGSDALFIIFMILLITGHLFVSFVVHMAIGGQLRDRGALS